MTELNESNYERVAAWLDGGAVELNPAEQELAQQIRHGETDLAGLLDASVPAEALEAARWAARKELGRRKQQAWVGAGLYVKVRSAAALAAAAVVIVAAGFWMWSTLSQRVMPRPETANMAAQRAVLPGMDELTTDEQVILAPYVGRFDRLQTDLSLSDETGPGTADAASRDPMSDALRRMWLEDVMLYGPAY